MLLLSSLFSELIVPISVPAELFEVMLKTFMAESLAFNLAIRHKKKKKMSVIMVYLSILDL
jgi:hypothetical protein